MRKTISGFTIIEVLIVVVVIGILAAIVIVSYSGSQNRAQNTSRVTELKGWQKSFAQYKGVNGAYPNVVDGGYCLGTGFPGGKCRDTVGTFYTEASSTTLMSLLSTYDAPKPSPRVAVNNVVGPYVVYATTTITLYLVANGGATDCPSGTTYDTNSGGRVTCAIILTR